MSKTLPPKQHSDFRPISITPVLTRIMEKTVVRHFLYPTFLAPPPTLSFSEQFAFRTTRSPTAAIICLLNTITNMLFTNPFVMDHFLHPFPWTSARHSTRYGIPLYWRRWLNWTCQRMYTTG